MVCIFGREQIVLTRLHVNADNSCLELANDQFNEPVNIGIAELVQIALSGIIDLIPGTVIMNS